MGWAGLKNGALLQQACGLFDVFVTVDQNVQFQRNLSMLPLPIIILVAINNRYETLAPYGDSVKEVLSRPLSRELILIEGPGRIRRFPER
jgi:hypothetical protein